MSAKKIVLTSALMRQIARYEITFKDLVPGGDVEGVEFVCPERYETTLDDLYETLKRLATLDPTTEIFRRDWFNPLFQLSDAFGLNHNRDAGAEEKEPIAPTRRLPGLETSEDDYFGNIIFAFYMICKEASDDRLLSESIDFDARLESMTLFLRNHGKPFVEREFSQEEKERYIDAIGKDKAFQTSATESELALARRFVEELCEIDSEVALRVKGFALYYGDRLYAKDWREARRVLTRVFEKTDDPVYADKLGDLYCYDVRDVSNYEVAFRYYAISAASAAPEGLYKLGDMFRYGAGVRKSERTASQLYSKAYDKASAEFLGDSFENLRSDVVHARCVRFANAALRMGIGYAEGFSGYVNLDSAFGYFLKADFATKICEKEIDIAAVADLRDEIEKNMAKLRARLPGGFFHEDFVEYDYPDPFSALIWKASRCELARYAAADGCVALVVKRIPTRSEPRPKPILASASELSFCELTHMAALTLDEDAEVWFKDDASRVRFDDFEQDDSSRFNFFNADELVATVQKTRFRFYGAKTETYGPEYRVATVDYISRRYDYFCDFDVQPGDHVVAELYDWKEGPESEVEFKVVETDVRRESELPKPPELYRRILRKA